MFVYAKFWLDFHEVFPVATDRCLSKTVYEKWALTAHIWDWESLLWFNKFLERHTYNFLTRKVFLFSLHIGKSLFLNWYLPSCLSARGLGRVVPKSTSSANSFRNLEMIIGCFKPSNRFDWNVLQHNLCCQSQNLEQIHQESFLCALLPLRNSFTVTECYFHTSWITLYFN